MSAAIMPPFEMYAGDTWNGIQWLSIRLDDLTAPTLALTAAKVVFFKAEEGPLAPAHKLESPQDIVINYPTEWDITIKPTILPLSPGEWTYRVITTDAQLRTRTWITGVILVL